MIEAATQSNFRYSDPGRRTQQITPCLIKAKILTHLDECATDKLAEMLLKSAPSYATGCR